jgi:hypothetical protein
MIGGEETRTETTLMTSPKLFYDAASAKSPRLHYPGEGAMLSRRHRFIPSRLFDSVFRRRFQLDGTTHDGFLAKQSG